MLLVLVQTITFLLTRRPNTNLKKMGFENSSVFLSSMKWLDLLLSDSTVRWKQRNALSVSQSFIHTHSNEHILHLIKYCTSSALVCSTGGFPRWPQTQHPAVCSANFKKLSQFNSLRNNVLSHIKYFPLYYLLFV